MAIAPIIPFPGTYQGPTAVANDPGLATAIPFLGDMSSEVEAVGVASAGLIGPEGPILAILGGVLTEVLGGGNANAQRVQNAINNALAANIAGNTQNQLNWGASTYAAFKVTALLSEDTAGAAWAGAQALARLASRFDGSPSAGTVSAIEAQIASAFNDIAITGNQVRAYADQAVANEAAVRQQEINDAEAFTQNMATLQREEYTALAAEAQANAEAVARSDSEALLTYAQQLGAQILADLTNEINQVNAALQAIEAFVTGGLSEVAGYAENATATGLANLQAGQNTQLISTLSPGWAGTAESANQAAESLTQEHPEEAANLNLMTTMVPEDATAAIAGLAVGLKTATQALNDCALPNCNLKNNAASQLKNLFNAAGDGALLAALVYAAGHPTDAAHDIERIFTSIGTGLVDAMRATIGLG